MAFPFNQHMSQTAPAMLEPYLQLHTTAAHSSEKTLLPLHWTSAEEFEGIDCVLQVGNV